MNFNNDAYNFDLSSESSSYPYVDSIIEKTWLSRKDLFLYGRADFHECLRKMSLDNIYIKNSVDRWKNTSMTREQRERYYKPLLQKYHEEQRITARQMNTLLQRNLEFVDFNSNCLKTTTSIEDYVKITSSNIKTVYSKPERVSINYENPSYKKVPRKIILEKFDKIKKIREQKRENIISENNIIKEKAFNSQLNYELRVENFYQNLYTNYYRKEQTARLIYNCIISLNKRKEKLINNELHRFYSDCSNRKREAVNKYIKLLIGKETFSKCTIQDIKVSYSVALEQIDIDITVPKIDKLFYWNEIKYIERSDTIKYCDMSAKEQNERMINYLKQVCESLYVYLVVYNGIDFCKNLNFYFRCPSSIDAHISFIDMNMQSKCFSRKTLRYYIEEHFSKVKNLK